MIPFADCVCKSILLYVPSVLQVYKPLKLTYNDFRVSAPAYGPGYGPPLVRILQCPKTKGDTGMVDFNIGIIGAGHIAGVIAETIAKLDGFKIGAIASKDQARADEFAAKYGIEKAYGHYADLLADPDIELVYIATVHAAHPFVAIEALKAGKPVLIEKPLSYNAKTAQTVMAFARQQKLFCGEAMWTRYMPLTQHFRELIEKKVIGDICSATATLGYKLTDKVRLLRPELAGGALLDLGIYPLSMIFLAMGEFPLGAISSTVRLNSNVDAIDSIAMNFTRGRIATICTSMMHQLDNRAVFYGTRGRIEIEGTNLPTSVRVYGENDEILEETMPPENQISGYEYEFLAARNAIIMEKVEPAEITHTETLRTLQFMDQMRAQWKISFPLPEEPKPEGPAGEGKEPPKNGAPQS